MAEKLNKLLLPATAVAAMITVVVRACIQAITIDEAVSYSNFALLPDPTHWVAHSNNHVLNSLLMRLFTTLFGASHLTVRAGAVIGAAIFIYAVYRLTKSMAGESILGWALFSCFVFNPFILDFLVAARGYSLALAFLALAVAIAFGAVGRTNSSAAGLAGGGSDAASGLHPTAGKTGGATAWACALVSICLALSFSANFAFAVVDAAAWLVLFLWLANCGFTPRSPRHAGPKPGGSPKGPAPLRAGAALLAAAVLPGLLVAAWVVGGTLRNWHGVQLVYGAESLRDTLNSLYEASVYKVNPHVVGPVFYSIIRHNAHNILPLLALFCLWRLGAILWERVAKRTPQSRRTRAIGLAAASIAFVALAGHEILFHAFAMKLPLDRTGIYIVFLVTLAAGALASVQLESRNGRWSGCALTAAVAVAAVYFLCCYRVSFFKEWEFDRDIDQVYGILAYYNHTCGIKDVAVNWRYDAPLNYYREVSRREPFSTFHGTMSGYPDGRRAYVLYYWDDLAYMQANKLTVAWTSPVSGATVALNPALDNGHPCEAPLPATGIRW